MIVYIVSKALYFKYVYNLYMYVAYMYYIIYMGNMCVYVSIYLYTSFFVSTRVKLIKLQFLALCKAYIW